MTNAIERVIASMDGAPDSWEMRRIAADHVALERRVAFRLDENGVASYLPHARYVRVDFAPATNACILTVDTFIARLSGPDNAALVAAAARLCEYHGEAHSREAYRRLAKLSL